ncbi:MAG TPA: peptide chain release factor 3 [Gemmatimonadota bacterium]|nr:peptide chain release factor 3 [Gemmatimonadota bacterium]
MMEPTPGYTIRESARRRTFAIISHPDAGKTTLTEKLLLFGGAIREAGTVKARRAQRHATSDWMQVERERGISVTSSVLQFDYAGRRINLLDTPGHQDFSEDTYRTLVAADSAVMLLDNRRGVEEQTRKLFAVCRMRRLPIFTFVNKCDRAGVAPLQLIDDVETDLGIRCAPVTWPVLDGVETLGVYDRRSGLVHRFRRSEDRGATRGADEAYPLDSPEAAAAFPAASLARVREEVDLLDHAGADVDDDAAIRSGEVSPTFFGSALLNFGVERFLAYFLEQAPPPAPREAGGELVRPDDPELTGFVFKIQANMDPKHRDRIAFVRLVSGLFEPGMTVLNRRSGKSMRLNSARKFMAQDREIVEEAVAGDVVGIHDRGELRIGDTLAESEGPEFDGIPRFSPERFARVHPRTPLKRKQLDQGLRQLSEEGAVQVLYEEDGGPRPIVGVVGALQFEILLHRLEHEYGADARLEPLTYRFARWATGSDDEIRRLGGGSQRKLVFDHRERPLLLFESEYSLRRAEEEARGVELHSVSP